MTDINLLEYYGQQIWPFGRFLHPIQVENLPVAKLTGIHLSQVWKLQSSDLETDLRIA
jgi:hypothetical protein